MKLKSSGHYLGAMAIRIDFHIHTISVENKDISFDFSLAWLKKYVNEANLDAIAITNHNTFDAAQYQEIREVLDCEVYPGIELTDLSKFDFLLKNYLSSVLNPIFS